MFLHYTTYVLLLSLLFFNPSNLKAQKNTSLDVLFGPIGSLEWSGYQRYQRPSTHSIAQLANQNTSSGQILNILPNLRLGFFLLSYSSHKTNFFFTLESGITYSPFSLDIDHYKGIGAISFPIVLSHYFIIDDNLLITIGAGVQFSKIEYINQPLPFRQLDNPFFMTYVGEIAIGGTESYGGFFALTGFARLGFNQYYAHTLDIGIRGTIGYPLL